MTTNSLPDLGFVAELARFGLNLLMCLTRVWHPRNLNRETPKNGFKYRSVCSGTVSWLMSDFVYFAKNFDYFGLLYITLIKRKIACCCSFKDIDWTMFLHEVSSCSW